MRQFSSLASPRRMARQWRRLLGLLWVLELPPPLALVERRLSGRLLAHPRGVPPASQLRLESAQALRPPARARLVLPPPPGLAPVSQNLQQRLQGLERLKRLGWRWLLAQGHRLASGPWRLSVGRWLRPPRVLPDLLAPVDILRRCLPHRPRRLASPVSPGKGGL